MSCCARCKIKFEGNSSIRHFEIYRSDNNDNNNERIVVCNTCLVGEYVPVFRKKSQRWAFGKVVKACDNDGSTEAVTDGNDNGLFLVFFEFSDDKLIDDKNEWVDITSTPFEDYLKHHRQHHINNATMGVLMKPRSLSGANRTNRFWKMKTKAFKETNIIMHDGMNWPSTSTAGIIAGNDKFTDSGHFRNDLMIVDPPKIDKSRRPLFMDVMDGFETPSSQIRLWTIEEDRLLLKSIIQTSPPYRWKEIAAHVPNRSGKQCRERYYNHLEPNLNRSHWTPIEDTILFQLYCVYGPRWALIADYLNTGRTNNNIKNRFHHIRRKLEKDSCKIDSTLWLLDSKIKSRLTKLVMKCGREKECALMADIVNVVTASLESDNNHHNRHHHLSLLLSSPTKNNDNNNKQRYDFQLIYPGNNINEYNDMLCCTRCGLTIPSQQTGMKYCIKTGWCENCCKLSSATYLCGDILRFVHNEKNERNYLSLL